MKIFSLSCALNTGLIKFNKSMFSNHNKIKYFRSAVPRKALLAHHPVEVVVHTGSGKAVTGEIYEMAAYQRLIKSKQTTLMLSAT